MKAPYSLLLCYCAAAAEGLVTRSRLQQQQQHAARTNSTTSSHGPSVKISQGTVHGKIANSTPNVRQFLGIPYGKPPLGDLRFAPPEPAGPFGDLNAKHLPPSCMQYLSKNPPSIYTQDINEYNLQGLNSSSHAISEDCLTLSIWAPTLASSDDSHEEDDDEKEDEAALPVVMFIYGGAFATGGEDVPYQIPAQWVQRTQRHIVVSFNYRVNIFGFPNAAGLDNGKRNLGLLDQRLAVEWVRDNIAAFGGDPARITLWGQSAGAISAGYYQFAYPSDPIVQGVIMDSGNELLTSSLFMDPTHSNFSYVAERFGCGSIAGDKKMAPADELRCMRGSNVSAQAIENFIQGHDQALELPFIFFAPEVDDVTVFSDYDDRAKRGQVAKIPAILGSNAHDGVAFVWLQPNGVNESAADAVTLGVFFCTAFKAATNRLAAGLPVYRYEYQGNITSVAPQDYLGAYHSSELPMIFGTFDNFRSQDDLTENGRHAAATSRAMQDAWLAFATSGSAGMSAVDWSRYVPGGNVRIFGYDDVPAMSGSLKSTEQLCSRTSNDLDR
ncbi:Alpha/Beta hydrolase protein [Apodospora peruviana]|uniref:Carboxylic ester hydrolase n=1 Tax=Apodospora peruviana TaxID=516989 RepID=A0AAE0M5X8_9PEZI|nr:Alpha/Beta hydrolase protein [Apodospora peruviana]